VVLTVRAVGAVTEAICRSEPGSVLGLRGPFGNSWPVADASGGDVVVVAGGIGLAPLRPVLLHALDRRAEYGEVVLLYGARTPSDLLYRSELDAWSAEVTVDAADAGWNGRVGVVPKLIPAARFEPARTTAFVVGPEVMMRFTVQALLERSVPPGRIFVSLERNMRCGLGHCGHCQLGPTLICRDGPVYAYDTAAPWLEVREL
jgi:anaerobic sulfite reductase subunit B